MILTPLHPEHYHSLYRPSCISVNVGGRAHYPPGSVVLINLLAEERTTGSRIRAGSSTLGCSHTR